MGTEPSISIPPASTTLLWTYILEMISQSCIFSQTFELSCKRLHMNFKWEKKASQKCVYFCLPSPFLVKSFSSGYVLLPALMPSSLNKQTAEKSLGRYRSLITGATFVFVQSAIDQVTNWLSYSLDLICSIWCLLQKKKKTKGSSVDHLAGKSIVDEMSNFRWGKCIASVTELI